MRTQLILILLDLTIIISNCYGQTAAIDSIDEDYNRGDFGLVMRKVKNELKSDTIIKNRVYYYWRLADVYRLDQHLDSALYFINIAIGLDEKVAYPLSTRADILYHQNKYKEALTDINKAIQLEPEWAFHYLHRALLYEILKKKRLAKLDLEKVKELAKKYKDQGLYDAAVSALRDL